MKELGCTGFPQHSSSHSSLSEGTGEEGCEGRVSVEICNNRSLTDIRPVFFPSEDRILSRHHRRGVVPRSGVIHS